MNARNHGLRRGVTLGEVLVALGVAAIALLTLVLFTSVIHRVAREGKSQAVASTLARAAVEKLRADPDFQAEVLGDNPLEYGEDEKLAVGQEGQITPITFLVRVEMQPMAGSDNRYYLATVEVDWREEGRDRQVVLDTYVPAL